MLPCLTFHMTHTWLRIIPSPTRTQRIFWITKVYGEIQQQKKYWNPYFHGLSFWVTTCTGFCVTLFSNAIPVQGNTPRRENRHHCSVSMVFMVHTPRCFWSTSARDRNKAERFRGCHVCLSFPLLHWHCKQCSIRYSPWADILWWQHSPCSLQVQVLSWELWVSYRLYISSTTEKGPTMLPS